VQEETEQEPPAQQALQVVLAHQFQSQEQQQTMQVAVAVEAGSALQVEVPAVLEEAVPVGVLLVRLELQAQQILAEVVEEAL
jgi:hypothetical protein